MPYRTARGGFVGGWSWHTPKTAPLKLLLPGDTTVPACAVLELELRLWVQRLRTKKQSCNFISKLQGDLNILHNKQNTHKKVEKQRRKKEREKKKKCVQQNEGSTHQRKHVQIATVSLNKESISNHKRQCVQITKVSFTTQCVQNNKGFTHHRKCVQNNRGFTHHRKCV